jgi:hypothetical protein
MAINYEKDYMESILIDSVLEGIQMGKLPITIRLGIEKNFPTTFTKPEILGIMNEAQHFGLKERWCEKIGHDLKGEANITPDSGSEYYWCKRCGFSHTVTWY